MKTDHVKNSGWIAQVMLAGLISAGLFVHSAYAHHGTAVNYEMDRVIVIEGTVTEFRWRNPHSTLFVDVTEDDGTIVNYAIELPSPGLLSRNSLGWTRNTFKPGDHIVFQAHPSRTGAPVAVGGCTRECDVLINGQPPVKEY